MEINGLHDRSQHIRATKQTCQANMEIEWYREAEANRNELIVLGRIRPTITKVRYTKS